MPSLIITTADAPRREVNLVGSISIGRHPAQDVQILDRLVSKAHARIEKTDEGYVLKDLSSRNGTYLNSEILTSPRLLVHGDVITIGGTELAFEAQGGETLVTQFIELSDDSVTSAVRSVLDSVSETEFLPAADQRDIDVLKRDYEKLRFSFLMQRELALELDLDVLLTKTLDKIFGFITGVNRGILLLRDHLSGKLEIRKVKTRKVNSEEKVVLSNTIIEGVLRDKKAVLSSDAMVDSRFDQARSIILQGIRSTMTVPMLGRDGEVVGILHLDSQQTAGVFSEQDLRVVQAMATQVALLIENVLMARKIEADAKTRDTLQRFLSPNLVDKVLTGEIEIGQAGELKQVTILFCDIRQFTPLSERHPPEEIVKLLNEYFESMVDIVFQHQGTLDKFIGDELMALWGAPITASNDAMMAVGAAVRMQQKLRGLNELFKEKMGEELRVGIGLDTGLVVAGLMGSSKTMSYTVIGSHVNRAARLCSAAKPGEVLISQDTWALVKNHVVCEEMEPKQLKGISSPVRTFKVVDVR